MKGIFNENGLAKVIIPTPKEIARRAKEEDQTEVEAVAAIVELAKAGATVVDDSVVPADRKWRASWVFDDVAGDVKGTAELARDASLARLRPLRDSALTAADAEYTVAQAQGGHNAPNAQASEAKRAALRAATDPLKDWVPASPIMTLADIDLALTPLEVLPS